ncbi:MAG TPA: hypothetical protein VF474_16345 [Phenylobacterium sp.]
MLELLLDRVSRTVHGRSGSVLYSGRSAFAGPSDIYVLGLNPGGSPISQCAETVELDIRQSLTGRAEWSAYQDECWLGKPAGTHGMQPRVLHLLKGLDRDPRRAPASNVVFVRTAREVDLAAEKAALLDACWPVHQAVIDGLGVRTILCFGGTAGAWVRERLQAHELAGSFVERNARRWRSLAHLDQQGRCVVTLTHPSIAKWDAAATDPTPFVRDMMAR